jgi:hypothetical protein
MPRKIIISAGLGLFAACSLVGSALATPSPNGPGQPGAPGTTCGSQGATNTPGGASNAPGSPFNPSGNAGAHYAGNPGTDSAEHSNSPHAVSQYDVACFQNTSNPGHK